jgi:hypothetical protein
MGDSADSPEQAGRIRKILEFQGKSCARTRLRNCFGPAMCAGPHAVESGHPLGPAAETTMRGELRAETLVRLGLRDRAIWHATLVNLTLLSAMVVCFDFEFTRRIAGMLVPLVSFASLAGAVVVLQHSQAIACLGAHARVHGPRESWERSAELAAMHAVAAPVRLWLNLLLLAGPSMAALVMSYRFQGRACLEGGAFVTGACLTIGLVLGLWKGGTVAPRGFFEQGERAFRPRANSVSQKAGRRLEQPDFLHVLAGISLSIVVLVAVLAAVFRTLGDGWAFSLVAGMGFLLSALHLCAVALFLSVLPSAAFERLVARLLESVPVLGNVLVKRR